MRPAQHAQEAALPPQAALPCAPVARTHWCLVSPMLRSRWLPVMPWAAVIPMGQQRPPAACEKGALQARHNQTEEGPAATFPATRTGQFPPRSAVWLDCLPSLLVSGLSRPGGSTCASFPHPSPGRPEAQDRQRLGVEGL